MGDEPAETPATEPTDVGDDAVLLPISRRTLRRIGFGAILIVVAAGGIGIGLVLAGGDDSDNAAPTSRRRATTTTSRAVTTTVPSATGDSTTADGSGSSGATEGTDDGAASAEPAEAALAEPPEEAPAAIPAPVIPTVQLSLSAIPLGCAGVGPTLRVTWSTTNLALANLLVAGVSKPILSANDSILLDVDCGRAIGVRMTVQSSDGHSAQANSSIVIGP